MSGTSGFVEWLETHNLGSYFALLDEEGIDDLMVLVDLSDEELDEIAAKLKMKFGHKRKLKLLVREEKEKKEEIDQKRQRQKIREEEEEDAAERRRRKIREQEEEEDFAERRRRKIREQEEEEDFAERRRRKIREQEEEEDILKTRVAATSNAVDRPGRVQLPGSKSFHYFASHKKNHSSNANATELLARATVDELAHHHLVGFFDVDSLTSISMAALTESIEATCVVVVFLDNETHTSTWVCHELATARRLGTAFIAVIDGDKYVQRDIIDQYAGLGFGYLFNSQVIGFSTEYRKSCWQKLATAITRQVEISHTQREQLVEVQRRDSVLASVTASLGEQFRERVLQRYGNVEAAWKVFDKIGDTEGALTRGDFKSVLVLLDLKVTTKSRGMLRKAMDKEGRKLVRFAEFRSFVCGEQARSSTSATQSLPSEVPQLPDNFRCRPFIEHKIVDFLTDRVASTFNCVTVQGMGGVGKSCVKAAIVRAPEVAETFDSIAWIGLSQAPMIQNLQRRLHLQLTCKELPVADQESIDSQRTRLKEAASGKKLLLILDDCWQIESFNSFNVINDSNKSKILVSSRISKLIKQSHEVQLSLMSLQESIDMLSNAASLDGGETPAALVEVANLCGRLPLCLNIAARIINENLDTWVEDVLPDMRNSMSSFMHNTSDEKSVSVQDSIIITSLSSITTRDHKRIKALFMNAAIFAEDQRVPTKIYHLLHAASIHVLSLSTKEEKTEEASATTVKRWLSTLVKRSLLLELVKGSYVLHDIIRDYCISKMPRDLQRELQRTFTTKVLSSKSEWDLLPAGEVIPRGQETEWFVNHALHHHVAASWMKPLTKDDLVCSWLYNISRIIQLKVANAIPLSEIQSLAAEQHSRGHYWKAACLILAAVRGARLSRTQLPKLVQLGLTSLDQIDDKDKDEDFYSMESQMLTSVLGGSKMGSGPWKSAVKRFIGLEKKGVKLDSDTVCRLHLILGCINLGIMPSIPNPTQQQVESGWLHMKKTSQNSMALRLTCTGSERTFKYLTGVSFFTNGSFPYWLLGGLSEQERGLIRKDRLQSELDLYTYHPMHQYMVEMTSHKYDQFLDNFPICLVSLRCADLQSAAVLAAKWAAAELKKHAAGETLRREWISAFAYLRLAHHRRPICEALTASGLSWDSADGMNMKTHGSWVLKDESAFRLHPHTLALTAQLEMFLSEPAKVERADVVAFLPPPGECKYARDRAFETSIIADPLGVRLSTAALELGTPAIAASHAKNAVSYHKNLFGVMHARAAGGVALGFEAEIA